MHIIESGWTRSRNGNFVCRDSDGCGVKATVYQTPFEVWQIIINGEYGGRLVAHEQYFTPEEAIERADEILGGEPCAFAKQYSETHTPWAPQKSTSNGAPTYGRQCGSFNVTVKRASSGKWFYMTYTGPSHSDPQGWFNSAEQAMQAFDIRHPS